MITPHLGTMQVFGAYLCTRLSEGKLVETWFVPLSNLAMRYKKILHFQQLHQVG